MTDQPTYIGEVDDPNFVSGGTAAQGTYLGEVDSPTFVHDTPAEQAHAADIAAHDKPLE
jgi:hypothetical protein